MKWLYKTIINDLYISKFIIIVKEIFYDLNVIYIIYIQYFITINKFI